MKAADLLKGILKLRVLVVGDLCLDQWCYYDPALAIPSAETGISRIAVVHSHRTPGAAGTPGTAGTPGHSSRRNP